MKTKFNVILTAAVIALSSVHTQAIAQFNLGGFLEKAKKATEVAKDLTEANKEFTDEEEAALGENFALTFLGAVPLHSDANLQRYVNKVGKWIAANSERPNLNWSFAVLDMPSVNAFAVPGGTIFVSSALVKKMKSEAELAGVLAHEIGHVLLRHHVNAYRKNSFKSGLGKVGGELVARSKGSALSKEAIGLVGNFVGSLYSKGLDQGDEYDADRVGVMLAARAGYDPYGLVVVLQKLAGLSSDKDISMMSTHPSAADRMAKIEEFTNVLDRFSTQPQVETRFQRATASLK
jgi:beta-barrel assembly-enhancing protease